MMEFLVEEQCHIPPLGFQALVESMPRSIEVVQEARWPNVLLFKALYVGVSFILALTCTPGYKWEES
jgi:hypothetical protein